MRFPEFLAHSHFTEIDSTNDEAKRLVASGRVAHGLVISADVQTKGRGRFDRQWISKKGNLYASLLVNIADNAYSYPQLSFVIALAIAQALQKQVRGVQLKWPNDVLVNGKKAGGILLEREGDYLIIGFGVNCAHAPAETHYPATCLAQEGSALAPAVLCGEILREFRLLYNDWQQMGFASIRVQWLAIAKGMGEKLRIQQGNGCLEGIFVDLAVEDGRLILKKEDGSLVQVSAGDVYF